MGVGNFLRRFSGADISADVGAGGASAATGSENASPEQEAIEDISKIYKIGELNPEDCESCSVCYPSNLSIDNDFLYNSAPKMYAQIMVATGKRNWMHDIGDEPEPWGQVCKALGGHSKEFAKLAGGQVRVNGTDLEFQDADKKKKVAVIVLPQFAKVYTDPAHCIEDVAAILETKPGGPLPTNATPLNDRGYILLCSHGKRDKRCGVTAPLMKQALDIELRSAELYRDPDDDDPDGVRVVFCNHVGGHKFAANALIYQNNGMALMLARLRPEHAKTVVTKTLEENTVVPEFVRSSNKLESYRW